jgi:hypothetical protein
MEVLMLVEAHHSPLSPAREEKLIQREASVYLTGFVPLHLYFNPEGTVCIVLA